MSVLRVGTSVVVALALALVLLAPAGGADEKKKDETKKGKKKKGTEVWTDPADPTIPVDFKYQGEYVSAGAGSDRIAAQVIALDKGHFQAVIYPGGLPGAGWDGKHRSLADGTLSGDVVTFKPATGKRRYKVKKPEEFSATEKFPPVGQKDCSGTISGDTFTLKCDDRTVELKKTTRKSPTMGKAAPEGAIVLFDGSDTKELTGGRIDPKTRFLNTDGKDLKTRRKFSNYTVHLEFLIPFRPAERDQGRGNSGFYQVDRYEVQILDSFGLEGKNNECGGIYSRKAPSVNMCLPPLTWQTYDIEFTNAVRDGSGKKLKDSRVTVRLNGVVVQDNVEIKGNTEDHNNKNEGTPGALRLQGHGNPVQFRNFWIVEKK